MTPLDIIGRVIAVVLCVVGLLALWLDACSREAARRSRNSQISPTTDKPPTQVSQ